MALRRCAGGQAVDGVEESRRLCMGLLPSGGIFVRDPCGSPRRTAGNLGDPQGVPLQERRFRVMRRSRPVREQGAERGVPVAELLRKHLMRKVTFVK